MLKAGFSLLFICAFLFFACAGRQDNIAITPPETMPLSRAVIGYGVVITNYTHVLDKYGTEGKSVGFLRKGAVVEVIERRPVVKTDGGKTIVENWVLAQGAYTGWLPEDELRVYDNDAKAQTASEKMPK
ncbi:MAG: hypothetical protein LBG72_06990 [Spirochaetaceae bacterium]|jgi:glycine/D-amino acid oxidase-like deaminating enzyme|nr:hypothetical protein [Spirochaetaceae bacterium]